MLRRRNAFTLVEMLIVVAVIGLLLSIALPALTTALQYSEVAACQSNMRQIALGLITYSQDNQISAGELPGNVHDNAALNAAAGTSPEVGRAIWVGGDHVDGDGSSPYALADQQLHGALWEILDRNKTVFQCPTYAGEDDLGGASVMLHYEIPTVLSGMPIGYAHRSYYHDPPSSTATADRKWLKNVPLVVEVEPEDLGTFTLGTGWTNLPDGGWEDTDRLAARRHMHRTHIAFCDSHVEAIQFSDDAAGVTANDFWMVLRYGDGLNKTISMGGSGNNFNEWNDRSDGN